MLNKIDCFLFIYFDDSSFSCFWKKKEKEKEDNAEKKIAFLILCCYLVSRKRKKKEEKNKKVVGGKEIVDVSWSMAWLSGWRFWESTWVSDTLEVTSKSLTVPAACLIIIQTIYLEL